MTSKWRCMPVLSALISRRRRLAIKLGLFFRRDLMALIARPSYGVKSNVAQKNRRHQKSGGGRRIVAYRRGAEAVIHRLGN